VSGERVRVEELVGQCVGPEGRGRARPLLLIHGRRDWIERGDALMRR
jgi:hypothetical protein